MGELIAKASLIYYYPFSFFIATCFIFILAFIYGYSISYLFGIRRTFTLGFFVIVLSVILVLFYSGGYLISTSCTQGLLCEDNLDFLSKASVILMLLLSHLFINLVLGHIGLVLGILFYFPSEWILKKYFKITPPKLAVEEQELIAANKDIMTTGSFKLTKDKI